MAIQDITKPMALDETLQATNTALGAIAKDETLQATNTALGNIEDDIEAIGTALGTLNTTTGDVAKDVTLGLVNTALGTINTALGQIKNAIDAMAVSNIGNMSALTTTDKSSLVGAVNEVAGDVSDLDTGKADKVSGATNGNLAGLNASGNLTDSGVAANNVVKKSGDTMTGNLTLSNASGEIALRATGSRYTHIKSSASGADRTNYFPNKDGTLATTDDLNPMLKVTHFLRQADTSFTLYFSGTAPARCPLGMVFVCGQAYPNIPICFSCQGAYAGDVVDISQAQMGVDYSAQQAGVTAGIGSITFPAHIGGSWGSVYVCAFGTNLDAITISDTQ